MNPQNNYGWRLILLLLFFGLFTKMSASNFTVSVTPTAETCTGNGAVTLAIAGTNVGNTFEIKIYNGTTQAILTSGIAPNNPFTVNSTATTSFSQTFNGFQSGTYNVVIIEYEGAISKTITRNFTIANQKKNLSFTSVADVCTGRIVTSTVNTTNTGTAPYIYTIRNSSGTIIEQSAPTPATSYTFTTSLPNGNYTMNVTDACGTTAIYVLAIAPPVIKYEVHPENYLGGLPTTQALTSCDTVERDISLWYYENDVRKNIPANRFPLTVTYTVTGYGGVPDTVFTRTFNTLAEYTGIIETPFYYGESNKLTISVTDNCGGTYPPNTYTWATNQVNFMLNQSYSGDCGSIINFGVQNINVFDYTANGGLGYLVTVEKLISPSSTTVDTSFNGTYSGYTFTNGVATFYKTDYAGFIISGVPAGAYRMTMDDNCHSKSSVINLTGPNYLLKGNDWASCSEGNGTFHLFVDDTRQAGDQVAAILTQVIVTDAPAAFRAEHGLPATGAISYDISYLIDPGNGQTTNNNSKGALFASGFPAGTYTFSYVSSCNSGTGTYTVHAKNKQSYTSNIDITCTGFVMNSVTLSSNYAKATMYVQKYYPESGKWGHPITGTLYEEGTKIEGHFHDKNYPTLTAYQISPSPSGYTAGANGQILTTNSAPNQQIDAGGKMRVIVQYGVYRDAHGNPISGFPTLGAGPDSDYCQEVLEEFVAPENDIILNNFMVTDCGAGNYTLIIDALGSNLSYQMIEKDGVAMLGAVQSENYFENLAPGKYKVKIADTCGRETVFTFYVSEPQKLPVINASTICEGGSGQLYINGFSYLAVTWTKDGGALPANAVPSANGTTLNFTNFNSATDAGTYTAHLSYPPTCLDADITYTVKADGETVTAGTGGTFEIDKSTLTGPLNLFDYLTGPYDSGIWTETTNSGQLSDYIWDATSASSGTYTFEYIVNGLCSATPDTATVTIILKSVVCVKPGNMTSGGTPTQVGITNQTQLSGWPQSVPNGFVALESKEAGMVISRVAHVSNTPDLINDSVKEPIEGMLVYDIQDKCVKLYNGINWNCIEKSCND